MTSVSPTSGWVRRLWGYLLRHQSDLVLAMVGALVGAVCQTIVPLIAREIVDEVIAHRRGSLWPWLAALSALALLAFAAAHYW